MTHPVDISVGQKIRRRRWLMGMTQQDLAQQVGVKFQQIQKYETGSNRVSASRLWQIAIVQKVSISHYFEDHTGSLQTTLPQSVDKDGVDFVRMISNLSPEKRAKVIALMKSLDGK